MVNLEPYPPTLFVKRFDAYSKWLVGMINIGPDPLCNKSFHEECRGYGSRFTFLVYNIV